MSYRRRRGLGGSGSWLDRIRSWLPGGGEEEGGDAGGRDGGRADGSAASGTGGADGTGGAGASDDGDGSGDGGGGWRRAAAVVAVLALLFGAGYLASAQWLFPASPEPTGGDLVEVPDLVGLTAEEARRTLGAAGLEFRQRTGVAHRQAPEDAVLAQSPLPGQYARPGAPVAVTVSLGPERRRVPDLRGLSDRQGRIVLERLGFGAGVDTSASPVERGRVVGTRPEAGTRLTLPAEVTVVVSEGPSVSDVPDLTGRHVDDVAGRLEEAGLELGEVRYDPEAFAAPGRVVGQSPPPGYALRSGGRVSVRVAGPPPEEGEGPPDAGDGAGDLPPDSAGTAPPDGDGSSGGGGRSADGDRSADGGR